MHGGALTSSAPDSGLPALPASSFGTYLISTIVNPPVVFSGSPLTGSTLSVPLSDFVTFEGSGVVHQIGITAGVSSRF